MNLLQFLELNPSPLSSLSFYPDQKALRTDAEVVSAAVHVQWWLTSFLLPQYPASTCYTLQDLTDCTLASEDRTLIEILEEGVPVNLAKYIGYVASPKAGAIATFSGTTRDTFEGKTVLELRYEAYISMTVHRLESTCKSVRSTWSLGSITVVHMLGTVPVGEASVFVAVSSVHCADALDACKFLIDEVKASVPIWKEVYTDGWRSLEGE
ncbi:hypothetical protein MLD38_004152 [Melastoma candidum]|uniref:Uncharacterized protein n=1 Tax=Melastoma candidum TaxID=119954 RepID=A0ACB9S6C0_9MYRT|nr:hypothetical protein MLD38_004152 [Melastoma candidum]